MALPKIGAPKYMLTLPSNGEKIEYRPYLVGEEKLLLLAFEAENSAQMILALRDVVSACTFGKFDPNTAPVFDTEYIFIQLRAKSVGENSKLVHTCDCGKEISFVVNLKDDIGLTSQPKAKITLKLNDEFGLKLKYPALLDAIKYEGWADKNKTLAPIAMFIESVYDEENIYSFKEATEDEIAEFIDSLTGQQLKLVQEEIEKMPGLYAKKVLTCECGKESTVELKGLQSFF